MDVKHEHEVLCRLCAVPTESCQSINDLFHISNIGIHQQVHQLAGFRIENEPELPRYFCENCKVNLLHAHRFRERLIEVHNYFKKLFKQNLKNNQNDWTPLAPFDTIFMPENKDVGKVEITSNISGDIFEQSTEHLSDFNKSVRKLLATEYEVKAENKSNRKSQKAKQKVAKENGNETEALSVSFNEPKQTLSLDLDFKAENIVKEFVKANDGQDVSKRLRKYKFKRKRSKTIVEEALENTFICEQCGMSFKAMKLLEIHAVRHEEKKFQCNICPAKFFLPTELKRHQISHTGEKPASCRFCNTKFLNKSNRNRHEKSQHLKLRPYVCELCGKAFAKTCLRKNHMLVHTKERAFDCKLCQKSFLRKIHLVTHCKSAAHKKNEMECVKLNS